MASSGHRLALSKCYFTYICYFTFLGFPALSWSTGSSNKNILSRFNPCTFYLSS